jgi:hypothetical protein
MIDEIVDYRYTEIGPAAANERNRSDTAICRPSPQNAYWKLSPRIE